MLLNQLALVLWCHCRQNFLVFITSPFRSSGIPSQNKAKVRRWNRQRLASIDWPYPTDQTYMCISLCLVPGARYVSIIIHQSATTEPVVLQSGCTCISASQQFDKNHRAPSQWDFNISRFDKTELCVYVFALVVAVIWYNWKFEIWNFKIPKFCCSLFWCTCMYSQYNCSNSTRFVYAI